MSSDSPDEAEPTSGGLALEELDPGKLDPGEIHPEKLDPEQLHPGELHAGELDAGEQDPRETALGKLVCWYHGPDELTLVEAAWKDLYVEDLPWEEPDGMPEFDESRFRPLANEIPHDPDSPTTNTPLAPSVEKAYYRKCIELKRRLNDVEAANDEAKIRRVRLERAVRKMRLERAFLLDEMRKRMEHNVDGSEGSGDEGMVTPPADRPHRDRRRRQQAIQPAGPPQASSSHAHQSVGYPMQHPLTAPRLPSQPDSGGTPQVPGPGGVMVSANAIDADGRYIYSAEIAAQQSQPPRAYELPSLPHGSLYGAPVGVPGAAPRQTNGMNHDGADDRDHEAAINRESGTAGEALSAGPVIREDANGDRRIAPSTSAENANAESVLEASRAPGGGEGGFTAVNQ